jgi:hypothetical protein
VLAWFEQSGFAERECGVTEALSYNALVQSWPEIVRLTEKSPKTSSVEEMLSGFD